MDEFCCVYLLDWLELMNDFEVKKWLDCVMIGEIIRIRFFVNFINFLRYECVVNYNVIIKKYLGKDYDDEEVKILKDYFCFGLRIMKFLF